MIVRKPMFFLAPDGAAGGGGGSGAGEDSKNKPAEDKPDPNKPAEDNDDLPSDPAELKALLKQERNAHRHTIEVHTEMKGKWTKREAEEQKAKEEALKKQGQFEALYNETAPKLQTLEATNKRQEAALSAYLELELKSVPDSMKVLIPDGDAASKLEWISKAKAAGALGQQNAQGNKGGGKDNTPPPNGKGATMTSAEFYKLPAKERAAYMAKGGTITE